MLAFLCFPSCPGSFSRLPHVLELLLVAKRIHASTKACVLVRHELAILRQLFERGVLEHDHVAVDVIEHFRLEYEESAVDPPFGGLRFLREPLHPRTIEKHMSVA